MNMRELGKTYNIRRDTIKKILKYKSWSFVEPEKKFFYKINKLSGEELNDWYKTKNNNSVKINRDPIEVILLDGEEFKKFKKNYYISNYGRIKRNNTLVEKLPSKKRIYKLVADYFVPNPNGYSFVIHKDGNQTNNHYTNLEWSKYSHYDLIKHIHDEEIIKLYVNSDILVKDIAKMFNTNSIFVTRICKQYTRNNTVANYVKNNKTNILNEYINTNITQKELSDKYKINISYINNICNS